MGRKMVLVVLCSLAAMVSRAQDANYWSSNYGPGGFFTPGAVIANNNDSGVFFYNPALLGFTHKNSTTISANIYRLESIKIKNGVGTGKDLNSNPVSIIPLMASGTIAIKGITLGYALINSPVVNFAASQRKDEKMNVLNDSYSPGPEYFIGQYSLENVSSQTQGVLSMGKKISPYFSYGVSVEGFIQKQTFNLNYSSRALVNTAADTIFPPIVSSLFNYQLRYVYVGLKLKAGIAYDHGSHHLGLVVTSPNARLGGTATLVSEQVISNIKVEGTNTPFNLLASGRQDNLGPRVKTPFSIAAGYAYDYGKGQLYVAAEYFTRIKEYKIITPRNEYFIRPDTVNNSGTSLLLKMKDAHKAIVNIAVGASYDINENTTAYLSLRTDFTYADPNLYSDLFGQTPNVTAWNNYYAQVGANFKKRRFNLRTGLLLGYGTTNKYGQTVNYDHPDETNFLQGNPTLTTARHFSVGLLFAYIHNL